MIPWEARRWSAYPLEDSSWVLTGWTLTYTLLSVHSVEAFSASSLTLCGTLGPYGLGEKKTQKVLLYSVSLPSLPLDPGIPCPCFHPSPRDVYDTCMLGVCQIPEV